VGKQKFINICITDFASVKFKFCVVYEVWIGYVQEVTLAF
jgi:hypothetical protein